MTLHTICSNVSKNNGSVAIITNWVESNQYEIESWETDTRYNFDISLEFERIQSGLHEVKRFLDMNHLSYTLNPELDDEMKSLLRTKLPKTLIIHDSFEWNCYYNVFKKQLTSNKVQK